MLIVGVGHPTIGGALRIERGTAFCFEKSAGAGSTWAPVQQLEPLHQGPFFGAAAVAISADGLFATLGSTAPFDHEDSADGVAYVFSRITVGSAFALNASLNVSQKGTPLWSHGRNVK